MVVVPVLWALRKTPSLMNTGVPPSVVQDFVVPASKTPLDWLGPIIEIKTDVATQITWPALVTEPEDTGAGGGKLQRAVGRHGQRGVGLNGPAVQKACPPRSIAA